MWKATPIVLAAAALGLVFLASRAARADDALRVRVNIAAEAEERAAIVKVMGELLQRLGAELVHDGSASGDSELLGYDPKAYVARVTVSMVEPSYALLLVEDTARQRLVVKRVARAPGTEELVREELGHIMLAAVEAVIAGATVGEPKLEAMQKLTVERERELVAARAAQPRPAPAPPAAAAPASQPEPRERPRAEPRAFQLSGALLYEVALLGEQPGVTHGPLLALAVRSPWPLGLGVLGSVQYRFPLEVEAEPVGMRSQAFALRVLATIEHAASSRLALRFGLGAGADVARLEPVLAADAAARTTTTRTLTLAVARALAGADWRASPWLSLWIAVAADLDLDEARYVLVDDDGIERTVSEPWRVRPSLLLGAALP